MNYNWGDPKKNSKLTAIMMTKAEASRKKRLSSVKSTLSNQLHPGVESKLRKKKKSPESARREASESDPELGLPENNNHLEAAYDPVELAHFKPANGNNDFASPDESSAHSSSTPIFEEFSLNAAAEGLFHPASTIEAFIEHDAKYKNKMSGKNKPTSGRSSLSSRSGSRSSTVGEYLPSLENQKLPVVLNEKGRRAKLNPVPSSAALIDSPGRESSRNQPMSSTRSDSDLHAPRRLGAVPSSADRNALDFYDHEGGTDDDDRSDDDDHLDVEAHRAKSSPPLLGTFTTSNSSKASKLGSSKSAGMLSDASQDDVSLTKKFEDLKKLMNSKKKTAVSLSSQSQTKVQDEEQAPRAKSTSKSHESIISSSSSSAKSAEDKASTNTSKAMKSATSDATKSARHASTVPASVPVVVKTPPITSKKDMKIRNGVSLSDLKEEHRAALEMLKELGGPMDTDYDRDDIPEERVVARTKIVRSSQSTKTKDATGNSTTSTAQSRSLKSSATVLARQPDRHVSSSVVPHELSRKKEVESPQSSSPVGYPGGSMVAKLRATIPSGRVKTPEMGENNHMAAITELCSDADPSDLPVRNEPASLHPVARGDGARGAATATLLNPADATSTTSVFPLSRQERSLENVKEVDEEDDVNPACDREDTQKTQQSTVEEDLWKHYDDDENEVEDEDEDEDEEEDDDDDDDEEDNRFESETSGGSAPVTARSVDLYGDEGFESEW